MLAYESLNHIESKFCLISMPRLTPCANADTMFYSCERSISREKSTAKFPSLVLLSRNAIMLQNLIIQFPLYHLSSDLLREVQNKSKFQSLSSESGQGGLREVVAYKRLPM